MITGGVDTGWTFYTPYLTGRVGDERHPDGSRHLHHRLLLVGTGATAAVAYVDLGLFNSVVMLGIAVTKATLVVLYFMHVRYGPRLVWVLSAGGFAWLAILIGVTLADYLTRAPAF